jgi:hypothetical protein
MRRKSTKVIAAVVAIAVAATVMQTVGAARARAGQDRTVFIYDNSGLAVFGSLRDGEFIQLQTVNVGSGWTHAASSRDTLVMYNANTGYAKTGLVGGGMYWGDVKTRYVGAGWTHLTASCDSFLLYQRSSGYRMEGRLQNGYLTETYYGPGFSQGWDLIDASCDTIHFRSGGESGWTAAGRLVGGSFTQTDSSGHGGSRTITHMTHTADSFVQLAKYERFGNWGLASNGSSATAYGASYDDASRWEILAGTENTMIFYDKDSGLAATALLTGGHYAFSRTYGFSSGWDLIAGAK